MQSRDCNLLRREDGTDISNAVERQNKKITQEHSLACSLMAGVYTQVEVVIMG